MDSVLPFLRFQVDFESLEHLAGDQEISETSIVSPQIVPASPELDLESISDAIGSEKAGHLAQLYNQHISLCQQFFQTSVQDETLLKLKLETFVTTIGLSFSQAQAAAKHGSVEMLEMVTKKIEQQIPLFRTALKELDLQNRPKRSWAYRTEGAGQSPVLSLALFLSILFILISLSSPPFVRTSIDRIRNYFQPELPVNQVIKKEAPRDLLNGDRGSDKVAEGEAVTKAGEIKPALRDLENDDRGLVRAPIMSPPMEGEAVTKAGEVRSANKA